MYFSELQIVVSQLHAQTKPVVAHLRTPDKSLYHDSATFGCTFQGMHQTLNQPLIHFATSLETENIALIQERCLELEWAARHHMR